MANCYIVSSRQPRQCKCKWCGGWGRNPDCRVSDELRKRIAAFASEHGRTWKAALRHLWLTGRDEGLLRQARNLIGPSGLDKISDTMLRMAE